MQVPRKHGQLGWRQAGEHAVLMVAQRRLRSLTAGTDPLIAGLERMPVSAIWSTP